MEQKSKKEQFKIKAHTVIDIIIQKIDNDQKMVDILKQIKTYISVNTESVMSSFYTYFGEDHKDDKEINLKRVKFEAFIPKEYHKDVENIYPFATLNKMLINPKFDSAQKNISSCIVSMIKLTKK